MGNRLSRIYTRTGDQGETAIAGGVRLPKEDARIEAIGTVDELNCVVGLILAEELPAESAAHLTEVQHDLFELGALLSVPKRDQGQVDARVAWLEEWLDAMNADQQPLKEFILPGGCRAAAHCHLGRTVCRRAERRVAALQRRDANAGAVMRYLNRLSDLLFVLSRHLNAAAGVPDVLWQRKRP